MTQTLSAIAERLTAVNAATRSERARLEALIERHRRRIERLPVHGTPSMIRAIGEQIEHIRPSWTTDVSGPFGLTAECYLRVSSAALGRSTVMLLRCASDMKLEIGRHEGDRSRFKPAPDDLESFARLLDAMLASEEDSRNTEADA